MTKTLKLLLLLGSVFLLQACSFLNIERNGNDPIGDDLDDVVFIGASLLGDASLMIEIGETFEEPGVFIEVEGTDDYDYDVEGTVGNGEGVFTLIYTIYVEGEVVKQLEREVIVVDRRPNINILGEIIVKVDSDLPNYLHYVNAYDYQGNDISEKITVDDSSVDMSIPGEYPVIYSVIDNDGRNYTITKIVKVFAKETTVLMNETEYHAFLRKSESDGVNIRTHYGSDVTLMGDLFLSYAPFYGDKGALVLQRINDEDKSIIDLSELETEDYGFIPNRVRYVMTDDYLFISGFFNQANENMIYIAAVKIHQGEADLDSIIWIEHKVSQASYIEALHYYDSKLVIATYNHVRLELTHYHYDEASDSFTVFGDTVTKFVDIHHANLFFAQGDGLNIVLHKRTFIGNGDMHDVAIYEYQANEIHLVKSLEIEINDRVTHFLEKAFIYDDLLILNFPNHHIFYTGPEDVGPIYIFDLSKDESDENFETRIILPESASLNSFGINTTVLNGDLYTIGHYRDTTFLYRYRLDEVLSGDLEPSENHLISDEDLAYSMAISKDYIVFGFPYSQGSLFESGHVKAFENDNALDLINTYHLDETNEHVVVLFDGEVTEQFFNGKTPHEGVYTIKYYEDGHLYKELDVVLDVRLITVLNPTPFTSEHRLTIIADEPIYYYSIDNGELIDANQEHSIEIEFDEEKRYLITLYDQVNKRTFYYVTYDATPPTIDVRVLDRVAVVPDEYVVSKGSVVHYGETIEVYKDYLLVKTSADDIDTVTIYQIIDEEYSVKHVIQDSENKYSQFGNQIAMNDAYVFISALFNNEDIIIVYDLKDDQVARIIYNQFRGELVKFEVNNQYLAGVYHGNTINSVYIWDVEDIENSEPERINITMHVNDISLFENYLAISSVSMDVYVYDLDTMERFSFEGRINYGHNVKLSDGYLVLTSRHHTSIRVYKINIGFPYVDYQVNTYNLRDKRSNFSDVDIYQGSLLINDRSKVSIYDLRTEGELSLLKSFNINNAKALINHGKVYIGVNPGLSSNDIGNVFSLPIKKQYVVNMDDRNPDGLFLVDGETYIPIEKNYVIDYNGEFHFYAVDRAGNETSIEVIVDDIELVILNQKTVSNQKTVHLSVNGNFNQVSIDGGNSFETIEMTRDYRLYLPQEGDYQVVVKNTLTDEESDVFHLRIDQTKPLLTSSINDDFTLADLTIFESDALTLSSSRQIEVHEHYLIVSSNGQVILYNLNHSDQYYIIEPAYSDNLFASQIYLNGDLLFVSHQNDLVDEVDSGSVYVYDLSKDSFETMFITKVTAPESFQNQGFGHTILFEDNMLFASARTTPGINNSGIVYMYHYDQENQTFSYYTHLLGSEVGVGNYFGTVLAYDHFHLAVSTNLGRRVYVYNLLKNPGDEGYETIIRRPQTNSARFGTSIDIRENLLVVYELFTYIPDKDNRYHSIYLYDLSLDDPNTNYYHLPLSVIGRSDYFRYQISFLDDGNIFSSVDQRIYDASDFSNGIEADDALRVLQEIDVDSDLNRSNSTIKHSDLLYLINHQDRIELRKTTYDYLKLTVSDASFYTVFDISNGDLVKVFEGYPLRGDATYHFYAIDEAGNDNTVTIEVDRIVPKIINTNPYLSAGDFIKTDKLINQISFDGGTTYIEIPPTKQYAIDGVSEGLYHVRVKDDSGNISSVRLMIIDRTPPTIDIISEPFGQLVNRYEAYSTGINHPVYHNDILYFTNRTWPSSLYRLDLSLSTLDGLYNYQMFRMSSHATSLTLYGDTLIATNHASISGNIDIFDLSKQRYQSGYHTQITKPDNLDDFEHFGYRALLLDTKLIVLVEGGVERDANNVIVRELENRIFVYDLSLDKDDEDYFMEIDNDYFKDIRTDFIIMNNFQGNLMITLRLDNKVYLYDLDKNPSDSGFLYETEIDMADYFDRTSSVRDIYTNGESLLLRVFVRDSETGHSWVGNHQYLLIDDFLSLRTGYIIPETDVSLLKFTDQQIFLESNDTVLIYDTDSIRNNDFSYQSIAVEPGFKSIVISDNQRRMIVVYEEEFHEYYLQKTNRILITDNTNVKSVMIELDGDIIELNHLNELAILGNYRIVVTDYAGNTVEMIHQED